MEDRFLERLRLSIDRMGQVVDESLEELDVVVSHDFRALLGVLYFKVILLDQSLHEVGQAVHGLSPDLKTLLVGDDLEKRGHQLSMEFELDVWTQVLKELRQGVQSSILDPHVVSGKAVADLVHSLVHVRLEVVLARLDDQTKSDETSLLCLPVFESQALLNQVSAGGKSMLLLQLGREASDGGNGSRVGVALRACFIIQGRFPGFVVFLALGKELNESGPEDSFDLLDFPQDCRHSFSEVQDYLTSLRLGGILKLIVPHDITDNSD